MQFFRTSTNTKDAWLDAIVIASDSSVPQYRQLYLQLKEFILSQKLAGKTSLPSTRSLAEDLCVSRNTVLAAYEQLETEGYIETRRGTNARVVPLPRSAPEAARPKSIEFSRRGEASLNHEHRSLPVGNIVLQPGMPDMKHFPFNYWRKLVAERITLANGDLFGYHSFGGYQPLREAIAGYLQSSRSVVCRPEQIVITNGVQGAIGVLAQILLDAGDKVLLEEPGYTGARSAFLSAGAKLAPLHVDGSGWRLQDVERAKPRLIYVSPSCQFPLGATMRMEQRLRLIEVAQRSDAWIIEDDCESEHRFGTGPVAALQGFDRGNRTIYVGTFSKILFPSLRIGYFVLPGDVDERINKMIFLAGANPPLFLQAALADFINKGFFSKHLRRMRRLYSARRTAFTEMAQDRLGKWLTAFPSDAGLHILWLMAPGYNDIEISERANALGMGIVPLSPHFVNSPRRHGLLMGYALADERETQSALRHLFGIFSKYESELNANPLPFELPPEGQ